MSFEEHMAMAVLHRWQEANRGIEIWANKEKGILLPFAKDLYDSFLRQIKIEMRDI